MTTIKSIKPEAESKIISSRALIIIIVNNTQTPSPSHIETLLYQ